MHWGSVQPVRPVWGSRGIALLFLDHGTRRGEGSASRIDRYFPPGKNPVPTVQDGWAPGPIWTGAGNLALTGIRSPDRPARSQSLYRCATWPTFLPYHLLKQNPSIVTIFIQYISFNVKVALEHGKRSIRSWQFDISIRILTSNVKFWHHCFPLVSTSSKMTSYHSTKPKHVAKCSQ